MGFKRILGILILLVGLAMLSVSYYIKHQVVEGRTQISSAQKKVDRGNSLFSLNPISKQLGQGMTNSAQKKIDKGQQEVDEYTVLANRFQTWGIVVAVVGVVVIAFGRKKKH